jgi:hypothetical protein
MIQSNAHRAAAMAREQLEWVLREAQAFGDDLAELAGGLRGAALSVVKTGARETKRAWLADRPRRRFKRSVRRARWARARGWRRRALKLERWLVAIWSALLSVLRLLRKGKPAWRTLRVAAGEGWATGIDQARIRRGRLPRSRPSPAPAPAPPAATTAGDVVDAEACCPGRNPDGSACDLTLLPGEDACPLHRQPQPSRRPDGQPETDADSRYFDLRDSGYQGPIDQDGYPVADVDAWLTEHTQTPPGTTPAGTTNTGDPMTTDTVSTGTPTGSTGSDTAPGGSPAGGGGDGVITTDLASVDDLNHEVDTASALAEQFEVLGDMLDSWASSLPDRLAGARWGTVPIHEAATGVAESRRGGGFATEAGLLREAMELLKQAVEKARGLGEHIAAHQATGEAAAFVPR